MVAYEKALVVRQLFNGLRRRGEVAARGFVVSFP